MGVSSICIMTRSLVQLLAFIGLLALSCSESSVEDAGSKILNQDTALTKEPAYPVVMLRVPFFQVREAPDVGSRSLTNLNKGERLKLLGPVSEHTTQLTLEEQTFTRPWLLVRTEKGVEGWVHAAVLSGEMPEALRLKALLSKDLAESALAYDQSYRKMNQASSVIQTLRQAHQLCGGLTLALQFQPPEVAPEVAGLLPALTVTWVATERRWQFFVDYKAFFDAAANTADQADEALLQLYFKTYPVDSIGYLYPSWKLEVSETEVYSLLGKGLHIDFLMRLDQVSRYQDRVGQEIDELKALIINDMTDAGVLYWQDRRKAIAEIEAVLDTTFIVLTPSDTLALHQSLQALRDTSVSAERRFNFRAGLQ